MNWKARIERLRQALQVRFKGTCSTCGRQAGQGRAFAWIRPVDPDGGDDGEPSKGRNTCDACKGPVDMGGAALGVIGADGLPHFKVFGWGRDPLADETGRVVLERKQKMGARKNGREP